jgi:hypothetical protein
MNAKGKEHVERKGAAGGSRSSVKSAHLSRCRMFHGAIRKMIPSLTINV